MCSREPFTVAMAQPRAVALRASNDRLLDELQLLRQKVAEHERREVVAREDLSAASKHIRTLMEPNVAARVFSIGSKADEAAFTAAEPEFSRGEIAMFDRGFSAPRVRRYVGAPSRPSSACSAPSTPRSLLLGAAARRPAGRPTARPRRPASALPRVDAGAGGAMAAARAGVERTMALLGEEREAAGRRRRRRPWTTRRRSAPARRPTTRWPLRATRSTRAHATHISSCSTNSLSLRRRRPSPPRLTTAMTTDADADADGDAFAGARGGGGRGGGALARRVSIDARGPSLRRRGGNGAMLRGRRAAGGRRGVAHCLARPTARRRSRGRARRQSHRRVRGAIPSVARARAARRRPRRRAAARARRRRGGGRRRALLAG